MGVPIKFLTILLLATLTITEARKQLAVSNTKGAK